MDIHKKIAWGLMGSYTVFAAIFYVSLYKHCRIIAEYSFGWCNIYDVRIVLYLLGALFCVTLPLVFSSKGSFAVWSWFMTVSVPLLLLNIILSISGHPWGLTYPFIILLIIAFVLTSYIVMFGAWLWGRNRSK